MKVHGLHVKDPTTHEIVLEIDEIDAPVGEIMELIRSGIVEAVKGVLKKS